MAWDRIGLAAILSSLVACGTATPVARSDRLSYEPPLAIASRPPAVVVNASLDATWEALLGALEQSSLQVVHTDPANSLVVATYRGSPEPFLDCGTVQIQRNQELQRIPGAVAHPFQIIVIHMPIVGKVFGQQLPLTAGF